MTVSTQHHPSMWTMPLMECGSFLLGYHWWVKVSGGRGGGPPPPGVNAIWMSIGANLVSDTACQPSIWTGIHKQGWFLLHPPGYGTCTILGSSFAHGTWWTPAGWNSIVSTYGMGWIPSIFLYCYWNCCWCHQPMCFQCLCPTSPIAVYCIYSHQVTVSLFASTIDTVWQFGIVSYFVHWVTIGSSPAHEVTTHQFLADPLVHVTTAPLPSALSYTNVYMDDFISLVQGNHWHWQMVQCILMHAVDKVFSTPLLSEGPQHKEPLSVKKMLPPNYWASPAPHCPPANYLWWTSWHPSCVHLSVIRDKSWVNWGACCWLFPVDMGFLVSYKLASDLPTNTGCTRIHTCMPIGWFWIPGTWPGSTSHSTGRDKHWFTCHHWFGGCFRTRHGRHVVHHGWWPSFLARTFPRWHHCPPCLQLWSFRRSHQQWLWVDGHCCPPRYPGSTVWCSWGFHFYPKWQHPSSFPFYERFHHLSWSCCIPSLYFQSTPMISLIQFQLSVSLGAGQCYGRWCIPFI